MKSLAIWLFVLGLTGVSSHRFGWGFQATYPRYPNNNYPQAQTNYPNTGNGRVELVPGTIDQLNSIDAKWVCTNQKTGDMMVIGTEKDGNTVDNRFPQQNRPGQNPWQQPQRPQQPNYSQRPQQPNFNPQQPQQPNFNPQQPQQPNFNPQQPQQPNLNPQQPQQPNFNPQQPQQPNFNPQQPQQPNFNPQQPQQPQQPNFNPQQPQQPQSPQQPQNPGFVEVPWTAFPDQKQPPSSPLQSTTVDPLANFDWASYLTSTPSSSPGSQLEFDGTGMIEPRTRT